MEMLFMDLNLRFLVLKIARKLKYLVTLLELNGRLLFKMEKPSKQFI